MENNEQKASGKLKPSAKRIGYFVGICILFVATQIIYSIRYHLSVDHVVSLIFVDAIFLAVFLLSLTRGRLLGELPQKESASYSMVFVAILCCCILFVAASFLPNYYVPMIIVGVILSTAMSEALAVSLGTFMILIYCVSASVGIYVFAAYLILAILGVFLAPFFRDVRRAEQLTLYVILLLCQMMIPLFFYYLETNQVGITNFINAIIVGVVACLLSALSFPLFDKWNRQEVVLNYSHLLEEQFPLVQDIKKFSMAEYQHARKVSLISAKCAEEIGAKTDTAAVGGFYYRLGKMEGEPEIDNALRLASNYCFPQDVMEIMEEYGAVLRRPQTRESAIVHMVDALITKIELFGDDTMASTWNQDVVIYQTLNELSNEGYYDESGLSINQFLRLREVLVKEDSLL